MIDSLNTLIATPQTRNFQKWDILTKKVWPNPQINNSYTGEIAYLRAWLTQRLAWLDRQIGTFPNAIKEVVEQAQVAPNPSAADFQFFYNLPESCQVKILIFNQLGQNVYRHEIAQIAGRQDINWRADVPNGIYFYEIYLNKNVT